ncbi:MAG: phytanoyl-CoA dioxygenase family protein [Pseudomonadota bacterium]
MAVSLSVPSVDHADFGEHEAEMERYRADGTARALAMDNRGPVRLGPDGRLDASIVASYRRHGFYVFQDVVGEAERDDIARDIERILDRAPVAPDAKVDRYGDPALAADCEGRNFRLVKPLSDPLGGTAANFGRHQIKMVEPDVPEGAPEWVVQVLLGPLQHSEACLRYYGNPQLLTIVASLNGEDFTPFNETLWIKHPRLGGSVSWHQDGWTHWDSPELDGDTHGFNTMMQLYGCDAANGLWVVPGSHRGGRLDIKTLVDSGGSDRLPDAVPLICGPGDIAVTNRQAVHGSFANTSPNIRVSLTYGFHRRSSVLNVRSGGVHNPVSLYDEAYIRHRSRMIMYGIDARRERFPEETPFEYQPMAADADSYRWTDDARAEVHDYNLNDIGI